MESFILISCTD